VHQPEALRLPPAKVAPEILFRRLSATPAPSAPLPFTFWSIRHEPLSVIALTAREISEAYDDHGEGALVILMARSLHAGGPFRLFDDPDEARDLPDPEVQAALQAWGPVWFAVCPSYGRCDATAWHETLVKGARHPSNGTACRLMGESYFTAEYGKFVRMVNEPDRYYGMPASQLTDGQIMCFRAARKIYEEQFKE
jgi:hypothetical protein